MPAGEPFEEIDHADLRGSIVTQETRCIAALLRPLCALTNCWTSTSSTATS